MRCRKKSPDLGFVPDNIYLCRPDILDMSKVLIIDDEDQLRVLLSRIISLEGYEVIQADSCAAGMKQLQRTDPDVVLCDVKLPDGNGVDLISKIKDLVPDAEVILLTAYGNIPDGVQAIKNGAFDYITKGDDNNKIIPLVGRATEKALTAKSLRGAGPEGAQLPFETVVGSSKAIREAVELARKVASTDAAVLLTGETGSGKEIFARAIHAGSPRAGKAFVAVNCSAFGRELLESELFGHKAGSFTGANKDKKGLFEEADHGTMFLDEIGEMPVELQAKLLRVLENGEFIKVGETKPTKVNVRIISATNRNLQQEIREGNFREDLYYRLSVFGIRLPSLADRVSDIEDYVRHFIALFSGKMGKQIAKVEPRYLELLKQYSWPGNVRELRNVVERSLIMAEGDTLRAEDLPVELQREAGQTFDPSDLSLAHIEKQHIKKMLGYTSGNKTEAARLMGIGVTTLYRKIEEYKL